MRLESIDKMFEDGRLDSAMLHLTHGNGTSSETISIDLKSFSRLIVKMMRRDGIIPVDGD